MSDWGIVGSDSILCPQTAPERRADHKLACDWRGAAGGQMEIGAGGNVGRNGNVNSGKVETKGGMGELPHNLRAAPMCPDKQTNKPAPCSVSPWGWLGACGSKRQLSGHGPM